MLRYTIKATSRDGETAKEKLETAVEAGLVKLLDGGRYKCEVCDKAYANKATVKQHLSSKTHLSKLPTLTITNTTSQDVKRKTVDDSSTKKEKDNVDCESPNTGLETALQVGQVTPLNSGRYRCEVCDKEYANKASIKRHIFTNVHLSKKKKYNVDCESPHTWLETALQVGQVTPLDSSRYRCEVCDKEYANKASIKRHLFTNVHLSKLSSLSSAETASIAVRHMTSESPSKELPTLSDAEASSQDEESETLAQSSRQKKKDNVDCESPHTWLETALQVGEVTPLDSGRYRCEVCDKEYANKASMKRHIFTNVHLSKLPTLSDAEASSQDEESETLAQSSRQKVKDSADCESPQERLEAALQAGLVTPLHGGAYKCQVCGKTYASKATIKPHLFTTMHHKRNFSEANLVGSQMKSKSKIRNDGKQLAYRGPGYCLPQGAEYLPGHLAYNPQATHESEAEVLARLFQQTQEKQVDLEYTLDRQLPPGRVDVFNYIYFHYNTRLRVEDRRGAKMDSINLQNTFTRLGYQVYLHENLTEKDTLKELEKMKKDCNLESTQALIVFFLSHGTNSKEFLSADGKLLNIDRIRNEFTSDRCPALAKKPKIFMTNYCRGKDEEWMETDGRVKIPRDIVTIYASKDGIVAYRLSEEGTLFVLSLCQVIESLTERTELRQVYHLLSEEMKKKKATSPTWEDFSFKKFFLEVPNEKS